MTLFWNASVGATNYLVKRSNVAGGPYASIGASASATFIDNSAVNNTTYFM